MTTNKRSIFWAVALFLSGILLGVVGSNVARRYRMFHGAEERHGPPPGAVVNYLKRELDLSPQQEKELFPIARDLRMKLDEIRKQNIPQLEAALDEAVEMALPKLNPQQQEQLKLMEERAKRRFDRRPRPRGD